MQIVADRGADLSQAVIDQYDIKFAPLYIHLEDTTYSSGVDIDSKTFYQKLGQTDAMPTTSMPSPGDFAQLFDSLAEDDPDIFYIHISSGLSGTSKAAQQSLELVKNSNVEMFDSKTLSSPYGWQVEAAVKALHNGWSIPEIKTYLQSIRLFSNGLFTLNDLKYLIHGGRISHLKGLLATALQLKPVIKVDKASGKYIDAGRGRTIKGAIKQIANALAKFYGEGAKLRIQLLQGDYDEGVEMLKEVIDQHFETVYEETLHIAPVLGAHTGPSMVGLSAGPWELFANPTKGTTAEELLEKFKLPGFSLSLLRDSNKPIL
jgi:DegV family protein with EDD domain